ncbi:hypothetical protein G9A89_011249 [Geosiphon pyriformis]|nr:hypothetical protein G9A89_011249 [Geosiphon pyriformis]
MLLDVCEKWDRLLRKGFKLKANLLKDFSNKALYHPELYIKFIENSGVVGGNSVVCRFASSGSLYDFGFINEHLVQFGFNVLNVHTDGSVKNLGSVGACGGAATYFSLLRINLVVVRVWHCLFALLIGFSIRVTLCTNLDVGVRVYGLLFSTFAKLQAIALALDCISALSSVVLHMVSQASLIICVSLGCSVNPDFCEKCWIKKECIHSTIVSKNLSVAWVKVKSHSGIIGNKCANFFVDAVTNSKFVLSVSVMHCFLAVEGRSVSGNARRFVRHLFDAVNFAG